MMTSHVNDAASMPPPALPQQRVQHRPADAVSVVSDSSVFAGAQDVISVTLRGLQKALRLVRNDWVAMLKQADTLGEDDLIEYREDLDGQRKMVWQAAWRLVNQAKTYADGELASNQDRASSILSVTEGSLVEVRKLWDATYYFNKNQYASETLLPTQQDIYNESPETGTKRALEMTTHSQTRIEQSLARRRTSTQMLQTTARTT